MKKSLVALAVLATVGVGLFVAGGPLMDRLVVMQIDRTLQRVDERLLNDGKLHVILCGTAAALPDETRAGPCTAILAGGQFWLIDIGPGAWRNLDLMNLPVAKLKGVLLTHYHSDHIGELGEAMTQSWIAGRTEPLQVYGPNGLDAVVNGFQQAYKHDSGYRVAHHDEQHMPARGDTMTAHTLPTPEGVNAVPVFEQDGLRVSAFRVEHEPVDIALGYRIEYRGRVVVVSGDTKKSAAVIHNAKSADLLVHEALATHLTGRASARAKELGLTRVAKLADDVGNYHTTPVEAAEVAAEAGAKQLLITHVFPPLANAVARRLFMQGTADAFSGPITLGEDGTRITLDPN